MQQTQRANSSIGKEAWFNPSVNDGHLIIVDRFTGKVQKFKLQEEYVEKRYIHGITEQELQGEEDGYTTPTNPDDVWGLNGWKRMRRLEDAE